MITAQKYAKTEAPTKGMTAEAWYQGERQKVTVISVKEVNGEDYVLATLVMEPIKERT